jgi:hypothetical protein
MFDVLYDIFNVNTFTVCVVLALTGWGALLINIATSSSLFAVCFVPGMGFGALAMVYALSRNGVVLTGFSDANTIIAATLGMVLGFLFTVFLVRVLTWMMDIKKPVTKQETNRPGG